MNKVLVILGMHRSGTSLLTQWLHACGLNTGENFLEADAANKDGYFEDLDFVRLHKDMLRSCKLPESGLTAEPVSIKGKYLHEKMKTTVELKNRLYRQWGWKDPRTCLFLSYYKQLLPGAKYIIIVRPYKAVVNSLIKRDFNHMETNYLKKCGSLKRSAWKLRKGKMLHYYYDHYAEHYIKVWMRYNEAIVKHTASLDANDFLFIDYAMLLNNAAGVFNVLAIDWGFDLHHIALSSIYKQELTSKDLVDIDAYVKDPSLVVQAKTLEKALQTYCTTKLAGSHS